jgi:rhamnulokinase
MGIVCQWLADATQMSVVTGPTEATALGNALVQWLANGDLASLTEGRDLVKSFSNSKHYSPKQSPETWLPLIGAYA